MSVFTQPGGPGPADDCPTVSALTACGTLIVCTVSVYTHGVLDNLHGFEWDAHNIAHIALHGITPVEVEETTGRRHVVIPAAPKRNEKRWKLFGTTTAGRHLVVVFTIRHSKMRIVTAYTMNQAERRRYAPQIDA